MSAAAARELLLARRSVRAALTSLKNADVMRELTNEAPAERACVLESLRFVEQDLTEMAAHAEARQVRRVKR